jgi:signal transduction histidine kinase
MQKYILKSSFRTRIILTFVLITVLLVFLLARISYHFVRSLYLAQLTEQVEFVTRLVAKQIEAKYLQLLNLGLPITNTKEYFQSLFQRNISPRTTAEIFIFNEKFTIILHSDEAKTAGLQEAQLLLYRKEIQNLDLHQVTSSLPFKGDDDAWYLWGFFRLDQRYWLAFRESAARLEKVDDFSMLFWYVGLAGLAVSIVFGLILARTITRPIDRLVKFSTEIGSGNFKSAAPVNVKGELGILSKSMNKMRHDLSQHRKEREEMLAQIAHEIRNPLGGIELLTNLTKEDLGRGVQNTEYLDKILKEVSALKLLITSYLNYSRPQPAKAQWVDLLPLIEDVRKIIAQRLDKKQSNFVYTDQIGRIWFDPNHLRQILINLVNNSIDFIAINGEVSMYAGVNNKKWMIEIRDNGPGISAKDVSMIFEPFYTTRGEGTGLGLAICRKLCLENDAQVIARNNSDKGCSFIITKEIVYEH